MFFGKTTTKNEPKKAAPRKVASDLTKGKITVNSKFNSILAVYI